MGSTGAILPPLKEGEDARERRAKAERRMNSHSSPKVAVLVLGLAGLAASPVQASVVAYVTGPEPWSVNVPPATESITTSLDGAFGAGGWELVDFGSAASVFSPSRKFIYIDGGDGASENLEAFIGANRSAMETWVKGGGRLFVNAARWVATDGFDLGFGASLNVDYSTAASAAGPHPIFTAGTGTSWTGNYFSHDSISGVGFSSLILDDTLDPTLVEKDAGSGHVLLGGMTAPFFQQGTDEAAQLRVNILRYAAGLEVVPEASTVVVGVCSVLGLGLSLVRQRRSA